MKEVTFYLCKWTRCTWTFQSIEWAVTLPRLNVLRMFITIYLVIIYNCLSLPSSLHIIIFLFLSPPPPSLPPAIFLCIYLIRSHINPVTPSLSLLPSLPLYESHSISVLRISLPPFTYVSWAQLRMGWWRSGPLPFIIKDKQVPFLKIH